MRFVAEDTTELLNRARTAVLLFLATFAPFAVLQLVAAALLGDSPIVHRDALLVSGLVNAGVALLGLGFFALNRWQRQRGVGQRSLYLVTTTGLGVALICAWIVQLHIGGSQSAHMGPLLLGTLTVMAWLLPRPHLLFLALLIVGGTGLLAWLELNGALPYAPVLREGGALGAVFLTRPIIVINLAILLASSIVVLAIFYRMRRALLESRATVEQRERRLQRSNHDLEQYARAISHDLMAPIGVIRGYLSLVLDDHGDRLDAETRDYVERSEKAAARMQQLVRGLLAYSRLERDTAPTDPCSADCALDEALETLTARVSEEGAIVERSPLPVVLMSKDRLAQVFQNLVGNALKYRGDATPRVTISAVPHEDGWCISVADNGPGFDPKDCERVFAVFARLQAADAVEGSGIGLAICRRLIEQAGGRIWVDTRPGEGAVFSFTLPAAA